MYAFVAKSEPHFITKLLKTHLSRSQNIGKSFSLLTTSLPPFSKCIKEDAGKNIISVF